MNEGVSFFVPLYNEEEILACTVDRLLQEAEALGCDTQIVLADNGSTDSTTRLLRSIAGKEARVLGLHIPERGVGWAMKAALPHFAFPLVVALDADLTIELTFIRESVRLLRRGCDIVVGSKESGSQDRPFVRRLTGHVFVRVMRYGLEFPYSDVSIGAKAYRTDLLRRFEPLVGWGSNYVLDVVLAAHRSGARIEEIPVSCHDTRRSHFNLLHEGVYRFGHLSRLVLEHQLGRAVLASDSANANVGLRSAGEFLRSDLAPRLDSNGWD